MRISGLGSTEPTVVIQMDIAAALLRTSEFNQVCFSLAPETCKAAVSRKITGTLPAVVALCYQQCFLANQKVRSRCGGGVLVWTEDCVCFKNRCAGPTDEGPLLLPSGASGVGITNTGNSAAHTQGLRVF